MFSQTHRDHISQFVMFDVNVNVKVLDLHLHKFTKVLSECVIAFFIITYFTRLTLGQI